jgi:hypothetical protein
MCIRNDVENTLYCTIIRTRSSLHPVSAPSVLHHKRSSQQQHLEEESPPYWNKWTGIYDDTDGRKSCICRFHGLKTTAPRETVIACHCYSLRAPRVIPGVYSMFTCRVDLGRRRRRRKLKIQSKTQKSASSEPNSFKTRPWCFMYLSLLGAQVVMSSCPKYIIWSRENVR